MPLLKLTTSVPVAAQKKDELVGQLSKALAEITRKPEQYVMVTLDDAAILMAGKAGPAAFVDVRGIGGLTGDVNQQVSKRICALLEKAIGIPPDRVYLTFTDVAASNWGWNSKTFG